MRSAVHFLILAGLLATSGCTVGPDFSPPRPDLPEKFRAAPPDALGNTDIAWWNQFQDPVLDGLIAEAVRNNHDVRAAAARVEEFAARIGITRSAAFPQVGYGGGAGRNQISREIGAGKAGGDRVSDFFNANLNIGWELDLWGRIRRATEAAREDLLAAEEGRRGVLLTLVTSVATGYIGLRSLDEQLVIAHKTLEAHENTLSLFDVRYEKGIISQLELSQIRSEYERVARTIPALERDISLLENSISVLLGRPPGPIQRGRPIEDIVLPDIPEDLPSDMLRRRPDLLAAEHRLAAANARIGVAIAEFYPRLSLTGLLGLASDDLADLSRGSAGLYEAAAAVVGPLFTAGRLESQAAAARAAEQQMLEEYLQAILTALRETEDSLITRSTTTREIEASSRRVHALDVYASLARKRYENGMVDYISVLDAERVLFDAQLQLVRLRANELVSTVGVYKAMGGGWVSIAEELAGDMAHPEE